MTQPPESAAPAEPAAPADQVPDRPPTPDTVVLTLWGVPRRRIPAAAARMGLDRRHLRRVPGLRFAKLLGTGDGRTFTMRDADPRHWGLLTVWDEPGAHQRFITGPTHRAWAHLAEEQLDVGMRPISSHGRWAGRQPFGDPIPTRVPGPVAALTRARLRMTKAGTFWRAVPPVSGDLRTAAGLRLAVGIGEAPIGLQGTFSLWDDGAALTEFAHRRAPHLDVVRRTATENWYVEELFARFAITSITGTFGGSSPFAASASAPAPASTSGTLGGTESGG